MERDYGKVFYHPLPVWRALHSVKEENDWLLRTMDPAYDGYAGEIVDGSPGFLYKKNPVRYGKPMEPARVDLPFCLAAVKQDLELKSTVCFFHHLKYPDLQKSGITVAMAGQTF